MRDWPGERVTVTGAAGFIGSRLTAALLHRGAEVRALVHYRMDGGAGRLDELAPDERAALDVRAGDLRDADWVRRSLAGADVVFHLGALVGIPYSYRSPRDVVDTNVLGTLNVLEAAREHGVARLVHTSTSEVYGSARRTPMDEAHPLSAQSPYAASKIAADQLALSYHRSFGVPVAIARPFNTYGPGQTARAVVPTIISQALTRPVVRLGATTPTRDLNFVTDTAAAFLAVGATPGTEGGVFNVATGVETSIADVAALVGSILGRPLEIETDEARTRPPGSEVDRLVGDATALGERCGWAPRVGLRHGLERTVDWVAAHLDHFRPDAYAV